MPAWHESPVAERECRSVTGQILIDAARIVSGGLRAPYGGNSFYSTAEWAEAAQCALDGDTSDLEFMFAEEERAEQEQTKRFGGDYADYRYETRRDERMEREMGL